MCSTSVFRARALEVVFFSLIITFTSLKVAQTSTESATASNQATDTPAGSTVTATQTSFETVTTDEATETSFGFTSSVAQTSTESATTSYQVTDNLAGSTVTDTVASETPSPGSSTSGLTTGIGSTSAGPSNIHFLNGNESLQITSPGYPWYYPSNTDMIWILQTHAGYRIRITFASFDTRHSSDFFWAGDGDNTTANEFFVWHRSKHPPDLISVGSEMWIRFTSSGYYDNYNVGFSLLVASVPSAETLTCVPGDFDCGRSVCINGAWQCDGEIDCLDESDERNCDKKRVIQIQDGESAVLSSTRYPDEYPTGTNITWILTANDDRKINITFSSFKTPYKRDVLRAGDSNDTSQNGFFQWSGSRNPPSLLSEGNQMWLAFTYSEIDDYYYYGTQRFQLMASSVPSTDTLSCLEDEFHCGHSICIQASWRCDFVVDCFDGSDEINCDDRTIFLNADETFQISLPSLPSDYPYNSVDITWVIQTEEDRRVSITYPFDTYFYDNTKLSAGDGNSSADYAGVFFQRIIGYRPNTGYSYYYSSLSSFPDLLSNGSTMWLRLESSRYYNVYHQLLIASSVPSTVIWQCPLGNVDCGHSVCISGAWQCDGQSDCFDGKDELNCEKERVLHIGNGETAFLMSTGYPNNYAPNTNIIWILTTEIEQKINVTFLSFGTGYMRDKIKIGDGTNPSENVFFEWSGFRQPPNLLSSGSSMWLSFRSSDIVYYWSRRVVSLMATSVPSIYNQSCSANEFDCGHSVCIETSWQCDYLVECHDGKDESDCDNRNVFLSPNESYQISPPALPWQYVVGSNIDITWVIQTENNRRVLVLYLNNSTIPGYVTLRAGDGNSSVDNAGVFFEWTGDITGYFYYGVSIRLPELLSKGHAMWLRLETAYYYLVDRLVMVVSSVPSTETRICSTGDIDCGHDVCVSNVYQCDNHSACLNGQDELNCGEDRVINMTLNETVFLGSTRYPNYYAGNLNITWILQNEGSRRILINFKSFDTQSGDVFRAGDGDPSNNEFFLWQGSKLAPDLLSSGNKMWLRFMSNSRSYNKGFGLWASSVPFTHTLTCPASDVDCGHDVCVSNVFQCDGHPDCLSGQDELNCDGDRIVNIPTDERVFLGSTLYPHYYPSNLNITWILQAEEGTRILIEFESFRTASSDVFRAGDGNSTSDHEFFSWQGTKLAPNFLSYGNKLWLRFTTDSYNTLEGFGLWASSVPTSFNLSCTLGYIDCGHSVCVNGAWQCDGQSDCPDGQDELNCEEGRVIYINSDDVAHLTSTRYPDRYGMTSPITWILTTQEDRKILVIFLDFQVRSITFLNTTLYSSGYFRAGDGYNATDNEFMDWGLTTVSKATDWDETKRPPDILSGGNQMWLRYGPVNPPTFAGISFQASSVPLQYNLTCTTGEFDCGHSVCINGSWRCDNQWDCFGGTDETNCGNQGPLCAVGDFDCGQSVCISGFLECDGFPDCSNGSDEENCVGCRNFCFLDGSRGGCWCDGACEIYGDCCEDYYIYCTLPDYPTESPGIDECDPLEPLHDCDVNAFCTDTSVGFNCTCNVGYEGNGTSCIDVKPPDISCPSNLTVYTDCHKSYSTVSLPDVHSVNDNSGAYSVSIDINGSPHQIGDTATFDLHTSPHLVHYNVADLSSNSAHCQLFIVVSSVDEGTLCLATGIPPNCICSSSQGFCTCSSGYCGHDCSKKSEGTKCNGPNLPNPNCKDINECLPGYTGSLCDERIDATNCPDIPNKCLGLGVTSVSRTWAEVRGTSQSGQRAVITCRGMDGAVIGLTGGDFGLGKHEIVCSSDEQTTGVPQCLISFTVSTYPKLGVPMLVDQCTDPGKHTSNVTWSLGLDTASDAVVTCSGNGTDVGPSGGVFGVGYHTVTCNVTNSGGCTTSKTFGFNVMVGSLIPFGAESGDSRLSQAKQENQQSKKDLISPTIYPPNFFPFCDDLYEKIYFTDDGVIILSNNKNLNKYAFPGAKGSTFPSGLKMIAPFWVDIRADLFSSTKNVFWQVYDQYDLNTNQDNLNTIKAIALPNVDAEGDMKLAYWALVVTWSNVQPDSKGATTTFQAVLLTDSIHSYVIFNYDPCNSKWDTANQINKNVVQGYTCGTQDRSVYVDVPSDSLFQPGSIVGNSGQRGRWVFQLDSLPDGFVNPRLSCRNWHSHQAPYPIFNAYYPPFANTCPCSLLMAWLDWRFLRMWRHRYYVPAGDILKYFQDRSVICFVRLYQAPGTPGPQCCYEWSTGSLLYDVRNPRVASVFERFPFSPLFYSPEVFQQWYEEDVLSRYFCCEKSTLCHLYIEWRPLMTCDHYVPTFWGWFWGDPHVRTLDGLDYTFNGLGEYTLVLIEDPDRGERIFELQGRTQRVYDPKTEELTDATSYSGFAALDFASGARVEIKLNKEATDLITTVNGSVVEPTMDGLMSNGLTVRREEDPPKVVAIFASDIQFSVGVNNSFVDVTVQLSQNHRGKSKGLLGVWDGNTTNDVLRRDGTFQEPTGDLGKMLERDFFEFGETWRVHPNGSHFYYLPPEESWDNMNNLTFRPQFLEDLLASLDDEQLERIKAVCGESRECLYDSLVLNDTTIGMATKQVNEKNTEDLISATNYPPKLTSVESITATVGQTFMLQIHATDPDGDNITFHLLEMVTGAGITVEGGLFSWTPNDTSKVRVGFLATDGRSNSTLEPIVNLCHCQNGGTCLPGRHVDGTNLVQDRFGVLLCECEPGWTGEFCEMDYDACAGSPCYLGVNCTDEVPPSMNSTCGLCPDGLDGDGKTCTDRDECQLYKDDLAGIDEPGCDQICENILLSFKCSCNRGYYLDQDNKTCLELTASSCQNGGEFYDNECVCPLDYSGATCARESPCLLDDNLCSGTGQECLPNANEEGFLCQCRGYEGYVEISDGSCKHYPSFGLVIRLLMNEFTNAYRNPTSTAFKTIAATIQQAILNKLAESPATASALSVQVTKIEEGSLIVTLVVSYPVNAAPSQGELEKVMSSSRNLTDGNSSILIDPSSVLAKEVSTSCSMDYCLNSGTCVRPSFSPWFTCTCKADFTGERCETRLAPVPPSDGLPVLALVFIITVPVCIFIFVVAICLYLTVRENKVDPDKTPPDQETSGRVNVGRKSGDRMEWIGMQGANQASFSPPKTKDPRNPAMDIKELN
ncbi:uncharacterized protein LOC110989125 [Acanthaster planci]|uniref:Uncharacterized protein LOC110989125 n=1 Tax=Acanthaster planci TaxID=133434 RepID=A0A8B7ZTR8_ACAPL|nr:uncharacterized protein LOC110989125 [Acanthaster planci]